MDDQYDYSDDLFKCLGDTYISVMTSQGDTGMCDHSDTPSHTMWHAETCSSLCVPSGVTCTSSFYDTPVDGVS